MESLDNELVTALRVMVGGGEPPSAMLKKIVARLSTGRISDELTTEDRFLLVRYFAAAFYFRDGQAHAIFGWFTNGEGELKDADIDRIMSKRIQQTRAEWDSPNSVTAQAS